MAATVGWVGVGRIGLPMAQRALAAGHELRVWSRREDATAPLVAAGARRAASLEDLGRTCDIIATIVGGSDDVLEICGRLIAHARPGAIFVEMTTAAPRVAAELIDRAVRGGATVLDAPVTGGVSGAAAGTLTAFVGGDAASLERARPLLASFCRRIVPCGGPDAGYRMKLVNQAIVAGTLLGLATGASIARAAGFEGASVKEALGTGTASGFLFDAYLTRMVEPGGAVSFTLAMLRKDVTLARAEAASQGLDCAFLDDALAAIDRACARHGGEAGVQFLAQDGRAGGA